MRKVVGFLVGFIVSLLITIAVAVKMNLVVMGPVWLLIWGAVGAVGAWLCARVPVSTWRRVLRRMPAAPSAEVD